MKLSRDFTLRQERDAELLKAYREELATRLASNRIAVRRDIINKIIATGRPRYHVSFEYAMRVVSRVKRKGFNSTGAGIKRKMWEEIIAHVDEIINAHPRYTLAKAVARVLSERRASKYYISQSYAYKLIYEITQANHYRNRRA